MTRALIRCEGAILDTTYPYDSSEYEDLPISRLGPDPNLNLQIDSIAHVILRDIQERLRDFVRIAAYIYVADTSVRRGGPADVYGTAWARDLNFVIPVAEPDFWNREDVQQHLCETLSFLTGDRYAFQFTLATVEARQLLLTFDDALPPFPESDLVILFSGGTDSLAAVLLALAEENRHPLIVSHRPMPLIDSRQKNLAALVRSRFENWPLPHVSVWVSRRGKEAVENSQRSRSFLYLALGVAIAHELSIDLIRLADNGIVSINLPKTPQAVGSMLSRSTHPKFIYRFGALSELVLGKPLRIENPLFFLTRADVVRVLERYRCAELLQETVSCHKPRITKVKPHCGVCSQCVDRRFGTLAAGLEEHDLVERYEQDIFVQSLKKGNDRAQAESYVRFAYRIEQLSDEGVFREFPQLYECILPTDLDAPRTAERLVDLLKRHAREVVKVMETQIVAHAGNLVRGTLAEHCLIRLVATGDHLKDPRDKYARKVAEKLRRGIPAFFQQRKPDNEREVQNAASGIFIAMEEELDREAPLLPFAGISTKPDFSHPPETLHRDWFFIDMKYVKTRQRLNQIVTEITSRRQIYVQQGACVLFGVHDPDRHILNDELFIRDHEIAGKVWVAVIR